MEEKEEEGGRLRKEEDEGERRGGEDRRGGEEEKCSRSTMETNIKPVIYKTGEELAAKNVQSLHHIR